MVFRRPVIPITGVQRQHPTPVCFLVVAVLVLAFVFKPHHTMFESPERKLSKKPLSIMVTGGNGYLAQHLIFELSQGQILPLSSLHLKLSYTVRAKAKLLNLESRSLHSNVEVHGYVVKDLASDDKGLVSIITDVQPDVVVHAAAMSSPKLCEANPDDAMRTNCPKLLLKTLKAHAPSAMIIYISTDQVYAGEPPHAEYSDAPPTPTVPKPINQYGKSKVAFEELLRASWPRSVVLRSSNILGERAPYNFDGKFLQWVEGELKERNTNDAHEVLQLFDDEYRSFVDVRFIIDTIVAVVQHKSKRKHETATSTVYNCGGPRVLSRLVLGRHVAKRLGLSPDVVQGVSASTKDVGYDSPVDLSMDSTKLTRELGVQPISITQTLFRIVSDGNL
eukprot:m.80702 g.80702  ORF g.80702 m.80702 type:complete len:391 (+) comp25340_c0_seq1:110-1282(+)